MSTVILEDIIEFLPQSFGNCIVFATIAIMLSSKHKLIEINNKNWNQVSLSATSTTARI